MKRVFLSCVLLLTVYCSLLTVAYAGDTPTKPKLPKTPEAIEKGKLTFFKRCSFCHGLLGDGNGPAAQFLSPRPRDFTPGTFKFRTTQSGELPIDENLFRTISRGLKGTAMQAFDNEVIKNGLTEEERWQVIYYIQTFAQEFSNPELDPYKKIVTPSMQKIPYSEESVAKGKEIFERAKCWECHGKGGKGDGQKTLDKKDDWGFPIRIRNVTQPWKIKAGSEPEDIFMRFSTGINGTPMPSFIDTLKEEERWHLANFIKSLQKNPREEQVLKAVPVKGDLPEDVNSPEWQKASYIDIRLGGSVIAAPRWQNHSVDMATVRALYNENEIAFLIEWDDPFKDVLHKKEMEADVTPLLGTASYNSYVNPVKMVPGKLETFRDSIALQFPVELQEGTEKPHFFRGDSSNPVNLWIWKADLQEEGKPAVEDTNAVGPDEPLEIQALQDVKGKGVYSGGVWKVIMKRPLLTKDEGDIQFKKGKFIPFSLNVWDGSNGEHGKLMSLSSWHYVIMETPVPSKVYLYTFLGIIGLGFGEVLLVRKINGTKV
ncbi:MAG: c-type cytochrome [Nitrospinae bacterium]|nr:c-type cytochrome [Nitrospinota bacterium]